MGNVHDAIVHDADVQDRDGAKWLIKGAAEYFQRLKVFVADVKYAGKPVKWNVVTEGLKLQIVKRTDPSFAVFPKGWIVERTFAWLMQHRRLCRDYERQAQTVESWIFLTLIRLNLRKLDEKMAA